MTPRVDNHIRGSGSELAYVVHVKTPGSGGGETRSYQVAQALASEGYRIHLYGKPDPHYSWPPSVMPHTLAAGTHQAVLQLYRDFSRANVKVCIERYQFPPFNPGFWVQLLRGQPIILELHGFPIDEYRLMLSEQSACGVHAVPRFLLKVPPAAWTNLQSFIFRHTSHFVVTSAGTRSILAGLGVEPHRVTVTYNRVDTRMFDPSLYADLTVRTDLGFDNDEIIFLYAGSVFHDELLVVIQAFAQLLEHGLKARLAIFGAAGSIERLKLTAQGAGVPSASFRASQAIPHHLMPRLLQAADVVLAPYTLDSERFQSAFHYSPLKIMEALAMAKPVITVNAAELRTVFESVPNLVFVDESSSDSWATAMLTAVDMRNSPSLKRGRDFVAEGYRWRDAAKDYAAIIDRLLSVS